MRAVPLLVGRNGMNTVDPFVSIDSGFMREATNFIYVDGKYKQRPAVRHYKHHANIVNARWHDGTYAILDSGEVRNYDTGVLATTISAYSEIPSTFEHAGQTILCGFGAPRLADYPFTVWTKTTTTITAANIECGMSHRRRAFVSDDYVFEWYAQDIQLVAGASASAGTDTLLGLMRPNEKILRMFSMTVQPGNNTTNAAIFFGDMGSVLIYDGDYPGATNWQIIGLYRMPKPKSRLSFCEVDGDILVFTDRYCYWTSNLLSGGVAGAYENRPSRRIDNLYQAFMRDYSGSPVDTDFRPPHAFHLESAGPSDFRITEYDAICCTTDRTYYESIFDYDAHCSMLVYKRNPAGWYLWGMPYFCAPYRNGLALNGNSSELVTLSPLYQEDESDQGATTIDIESVAKWPYIGLTEPRARRVTGAKIFGRNEDRAEVHRVRSYFDFGDMALPFGLSMQHMIGDSPFTNTFVDAPDFNQPHNGTEEFVSPILGLAGEGTCVSLAVHLKRDEVTGAITSTQDLYAATLFLSEGGIRS